MEENIREMVEIPEYELHRELILKWFKVLFVCEIVRLVISATGFLPSLSIVASIAVIVAMFKLATVNECYRKAGVLHCVSIVAAFVLGVFKAGVLVLALGVSICSLVAKYYELNAHSEFTEPLDEKLSGRWNTLFGIELAGGIFAALISLIPVFIGMMLDLDSDTLSFLMSLTSSLVSIVIDLLYAIYMKQTITVVKLHKSGLQ